MTTPAPLPFAYWVPNVSGGLVISDIEQRTSWDHDDNKRLDPTASKVQHLGRWVVDRTLPPNHGQL